MFDIEFYPTPKSVLEIMQIDCFEKIVLEPSAGKGDIVDYLKEFGAKEVIAFEKNEDLNTIVSKKCRVLGKDFFECKAEDISHINLIVMNPPFSNANKHIEHAFKIMPEGCELISLCNYESISKHYRYNELNKLIENYGTSISLGNCFDTAERKTNVEIGLIKLHKHVISSESDFSGFYMDDEVEQYSGVDGVMQYNEVRALVNRYVGAVKVFDEMQAIRDKLLYTTSELGIKGCSFSMEYDKQITTKEDFSKLLLKKSWNYIFDKMNLNKFVTSGVMRDINNFVETQTKVPFTMKNIYHMFDIIVGTREQTLNRALEEAIDNFTKHTDENRFGVEGWKTNSGFMLNKKFISGWIAESSWGHSNKVNIKTHSSNFQHLLDLTKVLCNLTGKDYNSIDEIEYSSCDKNEFGYLTEKGLRIASKRNENYSDRIIRYNLFETNTWYVWGFFEFKVYKKGTMHLKFKNIEDWYRLNQAYGKLKGFTLADKYKK